MDAHELRQPLLVDGVDEDIVKELETLKENYQLLEEEKEELMVQLQKAEDNELATQERIYEMEASILEQQVTIDNLKVENEKLELTLQDCAEEIEHLKEDLQTSQQLVDEYIAKIDILKSVAKMVHTRSTHQRKRSTQFDQSDLQNLNLRDGNPASIYSKAMYHLRMDVSNTSLNSTASIIIHPTPNPNPNSNVANTTDNLNPITNMSDTSSTTASPNLNVTRGSRGGGRGRSATVSSNASVQAYNALTAYNTSTKIPNVSPNSLLANLNAITEDEKAKTQEKDDGKHADLKQEMEAKYNEKWGKLLLELENCRAQLIKYRDIEQELQEYAVRESELSDQILELTYNKVSLEKLINEYDSELQSKEDEIFDLRNEIDGLNQEFDNIIEMEPAIEKKLKEQRAKRAENDGNELNTSVHHLRLRTPMNDFKTLRLNNMSSANLTLGSFASSNKISLPPKTPQATMDHTMDHTIEENGMVDIVDNTLDVMHDGMYPTIYKCIDICEQTFLFFCLAGLTLYC